VSSNIIVPEPPVVLNATREYRQDEDLIGRFLMACCSLTAAAQTQARKLYNAYKTWAGNNGEAVLDEKRFSHAMTVRGIQSTKTKTGRFWNGISLMVTGDGW
jgi:putative DNA primase/helicase